MNHGFTCRPLPIKRNLKTVCAWLTSSVLRCPLTSLQLPAAFFSSLKGSADLALWSVWVWGSGRDGLSHFKGCQFDIGNSSDARAQTKEKDTASVSLVHWCLAGVIPPGELISGARTSLPIPGEPQAGPGEWQPWAICETS